LTLLLLPSAMFSVLIQAPVMERAGLLFDAGNRANRAPLTPEYAGVGAAAGPLDSLLRAAELIDDGRSGEAFMMAKLSEWLMQKLAWIPPVQRQQAFLSGVASQTEPPVNGKLRQLLSGALWNGDPRANGQPLMEPPDVMEDAMCVPREPAQTAAQMQRGRLFLARRAGEGPSRAIFLPRSSPGNGEAGIVLRDATFDSVLKRCMAGSIVLSIPPYLQPRLLFDASLRYFMYSAEGDNVPVPSVTLQEIEWGRSEDGTAQVLQSQTRAVIAHAGAVQAVREAAGEARVGFAPTWRQPAGRALGLGTDAWRVVSLTAQRLEAERSDALFAPLRRSETGSVCAAMSTGWPSQAGFSGQMFEHGAHCFYILCGNPEPSAGDVMPTRQEVMVAIYDQPARDTLEQLAGNPPAPIASLSPFGRVAPGDEAWLVGVAGEHTGWLALRGRDRSGQERLIGAPWSTCALWRLGKAVQFRNPLPLASGPVLFSAQAADGRKGICAGR
jgi:hypothetical protein